MSAWRNWLDRARGELADKPPLRLGAWVVAAIVLVNLLLAQGERLAAARGDHAEQTARLAAMTSAFQRDDWDELLDAARAGDRALERWLWRADTAGQAQAQLQQTLTALATQHGFQKPRIQSGLTQPAPGLPDVLRVQARLTGEYHGAGALELLLAVAESEKKLVVDRLSMRRNSRQFTLLLSAYFLGIAAESRQSGAAGGTGRQAG